MIEVCDSVTLVTPKQYAFDRNWNIKGSFQLSLGCESGECKILMIPPLSLFFTPDKCLNKLSYSLCGLVYFCLCQGLCEIE